MTHRSIPTLYTRLLHRLIIDLCYLILSTIILCSLYLVFIIPEKKDTAGHRSRRFRQRRRFRSEFLLLSDLCLNYRLHLFHSSFLSFSFSCFPFIFLFSYCHRSLQNRMSDRVPVVDTSCDVQFLSQNTVLFFLFSFFFILLNLCHLPLCTEIYFKLLFASLFLFFSLCFLLHPVCRV